MAIKSELLRWYSILTPEYNRWKVGEYVQSLLSTTEWVQTEKENDREAKDEWGYEK